MDYLSLCLICKDENDYLSEWLDYHILMGVDRFYVYDNESGISLRETLRDYIARSWVKVIDIPGQKVQLFAYDHCLQTFGANTFWMGFLDTDEFLVPKTGQDLKEFLKSYEAYAGLAVSSLFFGSNGHTARPEIGQIAAYTRRTHETFSYNELVKCIVQPGLVDLPYSPHDFTYKKNSWCVNEGFLRVDNQEFPNHIEKIQLNHYFCRSEVETDLKIRRGRGDVGIPWQRKRFEIVNQFSNYVDTSICNNLEHLFAQTDIVLNVLMDACALEKMATLARLRIPTPYEYAIPTEVIFRTEIKQFMDFESRFLIVQERGDRAELKEWIIKKIKIFPQRAILFVDLAVCCLYLNDPSSAWQGLTQAWQFAPNSFAVLFGMVYYFLKVKNFELAESTCRLLLEMAPHNLTILGFLTEAMLGQGRNDEALQVGLPVIELSAQLGELPEQMSGFLVKKMADYLLKKKDFAGAVRLWQAGVKCQRGDVNALLELARCQFLFGDKAGARQQFALAKSLVAAEGLGLQNEAVHSLFAQVGALVGSRPVLRETSVRNPKKRR